MGDSRLQKSLEIGVLMTDLVEADKIYSILLCFHGLQKYYHS